MSAGSKRSYSQTAMEASKVVSPFMPLFESFRSELDEHHDRRERVIKASRDITAQSKKIIFSLQRVRKLQHPLPPNVRKDIDPRYKEIFDRFTSILPDIQGLNAWRYQRQISGGIQEFIEALSFQHYLETQRLITLQEAQTKLPEGVQLTEDDYVLGLFDLVGELMRFAITNMATNGELPRGSAKEGEDTERDILADMRSLRTCFETLDTSRGNMDGSPLKRDIEKKMETMKTCVEKVEGAVYGMIIRGRERPKGWVPDMASETRPEPVESY
ncbi:MAG: hypothetical protein Q9191_007289 [Dirinaria sp. TL-2023a]